MRMSNALNGYDEMLKRLIFLIGHKIIRIVLGLFQTIYWTFNGTLEDVHKAKQPEGYDRCVHVMNVMWYYSFDKLKCIEPCDYVLTHNRFESPDYIFNTDEVTIMTVTKDMAIFVESRKGEHLWKSECNSFLRVAQIERGIRLLFVPMHHFIKMGEKLGDPDHQVVCIFNSARCGSTLFTQIMEMTEICVSLSEPDALGLLSQWYREAGETPEVREAFIATMRWLCRPFSDLKQTATVIKFQAPHVPLLNLTLDVYPKCKFLYMYREIEKSAKSFYRMSQELPLLKLGVNLSKLHGIFAEKMINALGLYGPAYRYKSIDDIDICIFMWAIWTKEYVDRRKKGFPVVAMRYEDLVKTPRFAVEEILKYCELPLDCVDKGLRGLEMDSQRNSPVAKDILSLHKDPELTPRAEARAKELLKSMGIPPVVRTPILLEGTITCK